MSLEEGTLRNSTNFKIFTSLGEGHEHEVNSSVKAALDKTNPSPKTGMTGQSPKGRNRAATSLQNP